VRGIFKQTILGAIGFFGAAAVMRGVIPWPVEYGLQAKWEYFREHKDEFDAVFLGTSRVFRGVDTPLIDAELARRGIRLHSFNFGVAGMRAFEQDFVLHRLLGLEPAHLEWVFMEGGPWTPRFKHPSLTYSSRSVFWHTPRQTLQALESVHRMDASLSERLKLAATHLDLMLWRLCSYGQGRTLARKLLLHGADAARLANTMAIIDEQQGYQSGDQYTGRDLMKGREDLREDPSDFEAQVARIEAENEAFPAPETVNRRAVRGQYEAASEHGVELVYVVDPGYEGAPERLLLHREGEIPLLLNFNRPSLYPELYDVRNRFDEKHLNQHGAEAFSRILAATLAEEILGKRE